MSDLDRAAVARALTSAVATIWPITTPARLTSLTAGHNNLVYRVEAPANPPRILRVYRNHTDADRVHHEVALLAALRDAPLPYAPLPYAPLPFAVPTPLATHAGALVHQLPVEDGVLSSTLAVLWTELAGTYPDLADTDQAHAVGAALAAIDPASLPGRAVPPLKDLRRRVSAPDDVEDAFRQLPLLARETADLLRLLHLVESEIPPLYAHLPQQIIHADLDPSNVLLDGARVTGVLDFEFSHYDLRLDDLVCLLTW
jgi:Ser/Thr protein kinase RdoA (MazF antagonist)